jgi:cytidylate kinase
VVIAIDGPGGVGKSTVTRAVANELGYDYLDTGATYRAATVAVLQNGIDPTDEDAVIACVRDIEIDYRNGAILLNGDDVSVAVRSEAVTSAVSAVSAIPDVRTQIVAGQRAWVAARGGAAVVEGRDIGTVVFVDAPVKVFLTANAEVRASRRAGDAEAGGKSVTLIKSDLDRRDQFDAGRAVSPMQAADDAVMLDTSEMSVAEVVGAILEMVHGERRRSSIGPV